ncbi:MAG: hypothetical protein WCK90_03340 [archaeon]
MKREDILVLAQLLTGMKDAVAQMREAEKKKDSERMSSAKKAMIHLKEQIDSIL